MNKEAFPLGVIAEVLARLGGQTYGNMPKNKGDKPEDIGYPQAVASGMFGPIGTAVHGGIVDRRNQTGDWAGTKPSAVNRLAIGRILGGVVGAAAGYMAGDATKDYGGSDMGGALAGLVGGTIGGTMLGARSYNKAYKKHDKDDGDKKEKKAAHEESILRGFYKRADEVKKKEDNKHEQSNVSVPLAALSGGAFGPIGATIHGAIANARNRTGLSSGNPGKPGAAAHMGLGSFAGGALGGAGGYMAGRMNQPVSEPGQFNEDIGTPMLYGILGALLGRSAGSAFGAHSYNKTLEAQK